MCVGALGDTGQSNSIVYIGDGDVQTPRICSASGGLEGKGGHACTAEPNRNSRHQGSRSHPGWRSHTHVVTNRGQERTAGGPCTGLGWSPAPPPSADRIWVLRPGQTPTVSKTVFGRFWVLLLNSSTGEQPWRPPELL